MKFLSPSNAYVHFMSNVLLSCIVTILSFDESLDLLGVSVFLISFLYGVLFSLITRLLAFSHHTKMTIGSKIDHLPLPSIFFWLISVNYKTQCTWILRDFKKIRWDLSEKMTDSWVRHFYARRANGSDKMCGVHRIGSDTFQNGLDIMDIWPLF